MSELVLTLKNFQGSSRAATVGSSAETISTEILVLGLILATLQVIDGILTGIGVMHFGTSIEGNAVIRNLMEIIGAGYALVIVKVIALGVVALLCKMSTKISWLGLAMKGVIALYLCAAVLPWSYILLTNTL